MTGIGRRYFKPYFELGDTPNIVVDGAASSATRITLSHWPHSGTPDALKADTSAEIAFNYLASPDFHVDAKAVSNNHFDEDGLVGLYTLIEPDAALAKRDRLVAIAHAGDFTQARDHEIAKIAFALSAFSDPDRSPLDGSLFGQDYDQLCAALYQEMLPRLAEVVDHPERFQPLWRSEYQEFQATVSALADGLITIEEFPTVDLVQVTATDGYTGPLHRMAVNNLTARNRVLTVRGQFCEFRYRYESWVQYVSAPPAPRVELAALAEMLNAEETDGTVWQADPVSDIRPGLRPSGDGASTIPIEKVRDLTIAHLNAAPAAWDPYGGT